MVGYRDVWVYTFLYQNLVIIYVSDIVLTFLDALLTCNSFSRISRPWWQILGIPSVAHAVPRHLLLLKWVFLCLCSFLCHFQAVFLCKQYLILLSLWRKAMVSKAGRRVGLLGHVHCYITTYCANAIFFYLWLDWVKSTVLGSGGVVGK